MHVIGKITIPNSLTSLVRRTAYPVKLARKKFRELEADERQRKDLKVIEASFGQADNSIVRTSQEYSRDVFGTSRHWRELAGYAVVSGAFKEGWIPQEYFLHIVVPNISGRFSNIANLKTLSKRILGVKYLPDIGYYSNGLFLSSQLEIISEAEVEEYLFADRDVVVFKTDSTWRGMGVSVIGKEEFKINVVRKQGNGVFQRFIEQHEVLDRLSPGGVATLRIITILEDSGIVSVRGALLRMARSGGTHYTTDEGVKCAMDIQSGRLNDFGYSSDWARLPSTPDSGTDFAGVNIPKSKEIVDLCKEMHLQFPLARNIGWDITVERNGEIAVLEWGVGHGISFCESMQGPCFSDLGWERLWQKNKAVK